MRALITLAAAFSSLAFRTCSAIACSSALTGGPSADAAGLLLLATRPKMSSISDDFRAFFLFSDGFSVGFFPSSAMLDVATGLSSAGFLLPLPISRMNDEAQQRGSDVNPVKHIEPQHRTSQCCARGLRSEVGKDSFTFSMVLSDNRDCNRLLQALSDAREDIERPRLDSDCHRPRRNHHRPCQRTLRPLLLLLSLRLSAAQMMTRSIRSPTSQVRRALHVPPHASRAYSLRCSV